MLTKINLKCKNASWTLKALVSILRNVQTHQINQIQSIWHSRWIYFEPSWYGRCTLRMGLVSEFIFPLHPIWWSQLINVTKVPLQWASSAAKLQTFTMRFNVEPRSYANRVQHPRELSRSSPQRLVFTHKTATFSNLFKKILLLPLSSACIDVKAQYGAECSLQLNYIIRTVI